jgi:Fe-S-cluster containining protein
VRSYCLCSKKLASTWLSLYFGRLIAGGIMKKFYENGLRFKCTNCGECCKLPGGRVEIDLPETIEAANFLNLSVDAFLQKYCTTENNQIKLKDNAEKHCVFLEDDHCKIYLSRPLQCRTFPFWPENLKSAFRWKQLKTFCPGVESGSLFGFVKIEEFRKKQRHRDRGERKAVAQNENYFSQR